MAINYTYILGAIAGTYGFLRLLLSWTQDRREPKALATWIPFISPMIGMSRHKTNFYVMLRYDC